MIRRSLSLVTRRLVLAAFVSTAAVPSVAFAAAPAPAPVVAAAGVPVVPAPLAVAAGKLATAVEAREPIGAAAEFDTSVGALYAWVKVKNLGEASTITMVWKKNGKTKLAVTLPVGHSYGWKTWSKKGIGKNDAGVWTVEVSDANGVLLQTLGATVVAAAGDVSAK